MPSHIDVVASDRPRRKPATLQIEPLTPSRWTLFEELFGENGACGGCWCMLWRVAARDWERAKGEPNRQAMRALVSAGPPPGILAVIDDKAVGWCAVAPRQSYSRLERSRAMKPVDDTPVWSVSCLFVHRQHRRKGISTALLLGAARFARAQRGTVLEGYPVIPKKRSMPDAFAWTGTLKAFERAGFSEVRRWLPQRPIMRLNLGDR